MEKSSFPPRCPSPPVDSSSSNPDRRPCYPPLIDGIHRISFNRVQGLSRDEIEHPRFRLIVYPVPNHSCRWGAKLPNKGEPDHELEGVLVGGVVVCWAEEGVVGDVAGGACASGDNVTFTSVSSAFFYHPRTQLDEARGREDEKSEYNSRSFSSPYRLYYQPLRHWRTA